MDIQQGNVVTSKMMLQLRPGMTRSQVRFIMGSPLIQDRFHGNRWDYFYQMRKDGKIIEQRRVILEFENDGLARVRGDVIPLESGQHELATPATTPESISRNAAAKPKADEKGLADKLKFWESDEKEAEDKVAVPAKESPAPVAVSVTKDESKEEKGLLDKLKFWQSDDKQKPAAEKAVVLPVPVEAAPAGESVELLMDYELKLPADPGNPSNVSNPSSAPTDDLPPEASPDYFERMLEKIGF